MKKLFALLVAASVLILAGCPATVPRHGKFEETEFFPDGSVKKQITAESDYSLYVGANKVAAPVAKVNVPAPNGGNYVIEIPMVAGQTQTVAMPQQEKSFIDSTLDRTERWLDFALRGYGINRGAAVQIAQSNNNRDERVATVNGFTAMGGQTASVGIAGVNALGNQPRSNLYSVSGNALFGDGTLNVNSGNTTRNCQGGNAAPGGNGSATGAPAATGSNSTSAPGASGGAGGPANC